MIPLVLVIYEMIDSQLSPTGLVGYQLSLILCVLVE